MIIRVLFLGVGAALKDRQARTTGQALVGLCFTSLTSQEMSDGREGRLGRGVLSGNLVGPFPSELRLKFSCTSETQMAFARSAAALGQTVQGTGVGWGVAGSCSAEAAGNHGWRALRAWLTTWLFIGWGALGKSFHLSALGSSILFTPSQDCWKN